MIKQTKKAIGGLAKSILEKSGYTIDQPMKFYDDLSTKNNGAYPTFESEEGQPMAIA